MLNFRRASVEDIASLNRLNPVGEDNWKSEFWDHRMPEGIVCVSEDDEVLTGVEGYMGGYPLLKNGNIVASHRSERTLVLPSMRGKGVFVSLVEECHRNAELAGSVFCWGATSAIKPFKKAGFQGFEKWRKYYFIGIHSWHRTVGIRKFFRLIKVTGLFWRQRNLETMLSLGSLISVFAPRVRFSNSDMIVKEVDFQSMSNFSRQIVEASQAVYDDFALHIREGFLDWLESRGIFIKCVVIMEGSQVAGYVCFKICVGYILVEDFSTKSGVDVHAFFAAFKTYLGENYNALDVDSLVLPLNIRNDYHQHVAKSLPFSAVSTPALGSFVIKSGTENPDVGKLRLTPIWLEL